MSAACFTHAGTLVLPAVVPCESSGSSGGALPAECLEPERWSVPPEPGLSPIVPCDDPDDDDRAQVLAAVRTPVPPSWLRSEPAPSFADEIAREPVVLPMGRALGAGDRVRLFVAGVVALAFVSSAGVLAALVS